MPTADGKNEVAGLGAYQAAAFATEITDETLWECFRRRPEMYIGPLPTAHLWPLSEPLRTIVVAKPFSRPVSADITISDHQYVLRCRTGPLVPTIDRALSTVLKQCDDHPDLFEVLGRTTDRLVFEPVKRTKGWRRCFGNSHGPLLRYVVPCSPFFLERVVIAVKTSQGIRYQRYINGKPDSEIQFLNGRTTSVGLLTAASLSPDVFPCLPYRKEKVEAHLAQYPIPLTVTTHPQDDLLTSNQDLREFMETWMVE